MTKAKIHNFPALPGVYLMKDARGEIIYVGKGKNLRSRVGSYFRRSGDRRPLIPYLLQRVADIDYIVTDTEKEALLLENNLIKKYRPVYNVYFRDDKAYYHLRLDRSVPYPRPRLVRRPKRDGALYFGPFASGWKLKNTLRFLQKIFPFRTCSDNVFRHRTRPCFYYEIKLCPGPCLGLITPEDYRENIEDLILFLRGENKKLLASLRRRQADQSRRLAYEDAARTLMVIRSVEETIQKQKISSLQPGGRDVIALVRRGGDLIFQVLNIREGKMTGGRHSYLFQNVPDEDEALASFLIQSYPPGNLIPGELILARLPREWGAVRELLEENRGGKIKFTVPLRGRKKKLLEMARRNAELAADGRAEEDKLLQRIQSSLNLKRLPRVVEAFDISHLRGGEAVGSMVVFREGKKSAREYRHFRVRRKLSGDDYGMMKEVLSRRYRRAKEEGFQPDLIIVDGGKGQLNVLRDVLRKLELDYPDVAALAKEKNHGGKKVRDHLYLPGRSRPLFLPSASPVIRWLMRVRDESHRFAVTYHRRLRRKERLTSELEEVAGIGSALRSRLLAHFGGIDAIRRAEPEELSQVPGITLKLAARLHRHLNLK